MEDIFFELILVELGHRKRLSRNSSEQEWKWLFDACQKQAIAAFVFPALEQLNKAEQKAPVKLIYEWLALSERVRAQNELMNQDVSYG